MSLMPDSDVIEIALKLYRSLSHIRDPYFNGHERRVSFLAVKLGGLLGLDEPALACLRDASHLHDIGKLAIAESIMNKPRLSVSEKQMINAHAVIGGQLIESLGLSDKTIKETVLHHHENYDGTGYPNGLKGNDIPFEARIVRVVDCYDAMTNIRPYRHIYTTRETLLEMDKEIETSFDPKIYAAFRQMTEA
jgi:HD-GYP domain-containing protein (c-di-GMP phosphodiesterase class II)